MNTTYAFVFAVAAALVAAACGKSDTSTGPIAASSVESPVPHQPMAPPATKPPEVTLPPLPSDIAAPPEPGAIAGTAKDTPVNQVPDLPSVDRSPISPSSYVAFDFGKPDFDLVPPGGIRSGTYVREMESQQSQTFLFAIDLPVAARDEVFGELQYMGITAGSMFPWT